MCCVCSTTALIPQTQLRDINRLVSVSPRGTSIHVCRRCYTFFLTETLLKSTKQFSVLVTSTRITYRLLLYSSGLLHVFRFKACGCICRVYSMIVRSQLNPAAHLTTRVNQWRSPFMSRTIIAHRLYNHLFILSFIQCSKCVNHSMVTCI
jgi:hypothetical protein